MEGLACCAARSIGPKTTCHPMSLIQSLPEGPLDIVGDIHGEFDALLALLSHLGYDPRGHHPQGRRPVFVGDFCDRGPDSPAVLASSITDTTRPCAVVSSA